MRAALVPILLSLLLGSCTTEEVERSAYAVAKGACLGNPQQCTVFPDAQ